MALFFWFSSGVVVSFRDMMGIFRVLSSDARDMDCWLVSLLEMEGLRVSPTWKNI